jgi:hypothetical protein
MIETYREYPGIRNEFLRFQVGRIERRLEQVPVFDGRKMDHFETGELMVPVFRLLGWGDTQAKAEKMAREQQDREAKEGFLSLATGG